MVVGCVIILSFFSKISVFLYKYVATSRICITKHLFYIEFCARTCVFLVCFKESL